MTHGFLARRDTRHAQQAPAKAAAGAIPGPNRQAVTVSENFETLPVWMASTRMRPARVRVRVRMPMAAAAKKISGAMGTCGRPAQAMNRAAALW